MSCINERLRKTLLDILHYEMHGIQRLPSLLYDYPHQNLQDLNLSQYEILPTEPLYDISNHIKNIYQELPFHVEKCAKYAVTQAIEKSFNGKEAKNSADYRKSLLILCTFFNERFPNGYLTEILMTLAEIQQILYLQEKDRTVSRILRLHNIIFKHAMLLKIHFANNLKKLTERRFFGVYYHSLTVHARQQYRILSGRTANSEKEEAMFTSIKNNTNLTSNHHPENIISNAIIRYQAKKKLDLNKTNEKDTTISNLYKPLKMLQSNSVIPFTWIEKYPYEYQAHLESISDYLIDKVNWWQETYSGVMFRDAENMPGSDQSNMNLHHFRSPTLKEEVIYTNECWLECIKQKELIPARKIKIYDASDMKVNTNLNNLAYFKSLPGQIDDKITSNNQTESNFSENTLHQEIPFFEMIKSLTSLENISDICSKTSDNLQYPQFTTNTSKSNKVQMQTKTTDIRTCNTNISLTTSTTTNISTTVYPITSTPIKLKEKNINTQPDSILSFKIKATNIDSESRNSYLSSSSKMLLRLNIDSKLIAFYDKLRKQLKNKHYDNYKEYKTIIVQLEVKLVSKESELKEQLRKFEKSILFESDSLKTKPETETLIYNDLILKLNYIRTLKNDMKINN